MTIAIIAIIALAIIVVILNKQRKHQATSEAKNAYMKAVQYSDRQADDAIRRASKFNADLAARIDDRLDAMSADITSLKKDNARLRFELEEQKKKLNLHINPEKVAGTLTDNENPEDRARAIEAVIRGKMPLDDEQELALSYMENSRKNLFITGKAGTGKSFILEIFARTTAKSNIILAPTGIAALNVSGATLHSTFGYDNLVRLDVDKISEDTIRLKSEKRLVLQRVESIIIDEISMVRADTFDKIDRILRVVNRSDKPFGGKQMIVFGDLFQLPPIAKGAEWKYLNEKYDGIYFFHSNAFRSGDFKFIELTQNHRQKEDAAFFSILNHIREGTASYQDIELLNSRYTPYESAYDMYTALVPTKAEAEQINRRLIEQLETPEYSYKAKVILDEKPNKNRSIENSFQIQNDLRLRKDAKVMMVANDADHRWVNGTFGIINQLSKDRIVVSFDEGKTYDVLPCQFDEQEITYSGGKITYKTVFSVMQYPLVPAYAITIHKSQGQTFNDISCDIDRCFTSGQAYVALSRCTSLKGLHLRSLISPVSIKVDPSVLDFYREQTDRILEDDLPF